MREIHIMDQTLRDAHQCLWATRMTTAMMLPVAERMDRIGFQAIDLAANILFDVAVRYLKEDPWHRTRLMREKLVNTPIQADIRGRCLSGFSFVPDDIVNLWVERSVASGCRRVRVVDALNDLDNIVGSLQKARDSGAQAIGALAYSHSPVHTDEFYASKAAELLRRVKIDALQLKDPGGLLTPERVRTLVPALVMELGDVPLEIHSHCLTGLAPLAYLEAARLGASQLHTSIAPLANGPAQPAAQTIVRNLRAMGFAVNVDDALIDEVGEHFRQVADQEGFPLGVPMAYDAFHYEHQIPGGMLNNFRVQLTEAKMLDKFDAVVEECARVRRELAWPIMVTPFAQLVGVQALVNVIYGERYRVVPDEVKKYALGHYGKLLAPIDSEVLDRICENGSPHITEKPEPLPPGVPALRRRYPHASDEERLLRCMFAGSQVDDMIAAGPTKTAYTIEKPVVALIRALAKRPKHSRVMIQRGDVTLDVRRSMSAQGTAH